VRPMRAPKCFGSAAIVRKVFGGQVKQQCEWVVYAKRPFAGPEAVIAYLSRYTHRVAISNSRLLACDERGVTFRWKDYRAEGRTRHKSMTLATQEFMRRFLLHVLPSGFSSHPPLWPARPCAPQAKHRHGTCAVCRDLRHTFIPIPIEHGHRTDPLDPRSCASTAGAPMLIIETFERAQHIRAPPRLERFNLSARRSQRSTAPPAHHQSVSARAPMPWRQQIRLHCTDQRHQLARTVITAAYSRHYQALPMLTSTSLHTDTASAQIHIVLRRY